MKVTIRIVSRKGAVDTKQLTGETRLKNAEEILKKATQAINKVANQEIQFINPPKTKSHTIIVFPKTVAKCLKSRCQGISKHEYSSEELATIIKEEGLIVCK